MEGVERGTAEKALIADIIEARRVGAYRIRPRRNTTPSSDRRRRIDCDAPLSGRRIDCNVPSLRAKHLLLQTT
ncbi:MAG: hypothetical protein ACJ8CR_37730, partial [Roseiflexaceae bacterium]